MAVHGRDNTSDIYTNAAVVGISVRDDISDDAVYAMTKSFWGNVEAERDTSPWMNRVTLDYAVQEGGMLVHSDITRKWGSPFPMDQMLIELV